MNHEEREGASISSASQCITIIRAEQHWLCSIAATAFPPDQQTSPKAVMKKIVIQRIVAGFRLHEAVSMGDIGENDPNRRNAQLLGVMYSVFVTLIYI